MVEAEDVLLAKAADSLVAAESEFAAGRYDNVANRCYYACFQAAVAALEAAGFHPRGRSRDRWSHSGVQAQFVGVLINRRKQYPSSLGNVLSMAFTARQKADYTRNRVSANDARRLLHRSREFVGAIQASARNSQR